MILFTYCLITSYNTISLTEWCKTTVFYFSNVAANACSVASWSTKNKHRGSKDQEMLFYFCWFFFVKVNPNFKVKGGRSSTRITEENGVVVG